MGAVNARTPRFRSGPGGSQHTPTTQRTASRLPRGAGHPRVRSRCFFFSSPPPRHVARNLIKKNKRRRERISPFRDPGGVRAGRGMRMSYSSPPTEFLFQARVVQLPRLCFGSPLARSSKRNVQKTTTRVKNTQVTRHQSCELSG